jgi:hypothetical protein
MSSTHDVVPDEMVLAAIDRAERHRARDNDVPAWAILEHLDIPKRSPRARNVRSRLPILEGRGSLRQGRRQGVQTWALTSTGRRRLTQARRAGHLPALPESPQHRAWRDARMVAAQEMDGFLVSVREGLDDAMRLLDADPAAASDAWFELGERLHRDCRRVGSATHCLHEWSEPDDARADVDDRHDAADERFDPDERAKRRARRTGRRNVAHWGTPAREAT